MAEINPSDESVPPSSNLAGSASVNPYTASSPPSDPFVATNVSVPFPSTPKIIALVGFMWVAYFLNYCDRQAVFAMFKVLKADLAMTDTQLGWVGAIFLWVYGIGCPIAGKLADTFSKRHLVVASLVIWSAVTVLTGMSISVWMLLGLRAAMGISEALYMPAAIALTANSTPNHQRSRAIAILTTAQIAGTVAGAWCGGWMAERGLWRYAFFALGAVGILYAVPYGLFLRYVSELSSPPNEDLGADRQEALKQSNSSVSLVVIPTFWLLCVAFPIFVFGLWMLYAWLPNYLQEKFNLGLADAAFAATGSMQSSTMVGLFLGGILADKLAQHTRSARFWLLCLSMLACAPCMHMIGQCRSLTSTYPWLIGFGLFSSLMIGNIFPAAFEVVPKASRATAVGVLNFCGAMLSGFAPLAVGAWKSSVGIERMLSLAGLAYLVGAIVIWWAIQFLLRRDLVEAEQ
ncbi:MAG: MFS transporter [Planctomycetes bacterium]|nr:MFS transporter [Planctomycetota bacterium]